MLAQPIVTPMADGGVASCAAHARAGGASPLPSAPWPVSPDPPTYRPYDASRYRIGSGRPSRGGQCPSPTDAHQPHPRLHSCAAFLLLARARLAQDGCPPEQRNLYLVGCLSAWLARGRWNWSREMRRLRRHGSSLRRYWVGRATRCRGLVRGGNLAPVTRARTTRVGLHHLCGPARYRACRARARCTDLGLGP
jgi:hypothetical protein